MLRGKGLFGVVALAAVGLVSCGGNITFPSPKVTSLSPSSVTAGQPGFVLTVNGRDFVPASLIELNGSPRRTIFSSSAQLMTQVSAFDIAAPATITVNVFTAPPGGGVSSNLTLTVNPALTPVPSIISISPTTTLAGTTQLNVRITGTNFVPQSVVSINGINRSTTFANSTSLQVQLAQSDLALTGDVSLEVVNPPPGGGASNPAILSVVNPSPLVTTLSPTSTTAGQSSFLLTVNGSGLDMASVVNFNGSARSTTFFSNTQVTATLTQADLAQAGTAQVQVTNPQPGGGTSNTVNFSINPGTNGAGLPVLVDVSSSGAQANNGVGNVSFPGPVNGGRAGLLSLPRIRTTSSPRTQTASLISSFEIRASESQPPARRGRPLSAFPPPEIRPMLPAKSRRWTSQGGSSPLLRPPPT